MKQSNNRLLGSIGERIALIYLQIKHCRIIQVNYFKRFGEIDLIVQEPNKTIIFVEVKTMRHRQGLLLPEDQLTVAKLRRLKRMGEFFANAHPELIDEERGWRIDLIAVLLERAATGKWRAKIKHYENIG